MEAAAGPSMQAPTSQPLLKSPKKSPKKYPRSINNSPKNSPSKPSSSNAIPQNDTNKVHIKVLKRSNDPGTSRSQVPFPRRTPNEALISAIENHLNKGIVSKSEERPAPAVDSLKITVQNCAPTMRIVQSEPQSIPNGGQVVGPNNIVPKPQSRFPKPFHSDNVQRQNNYPLNSPQNNSSQNDLNRPQNRNVYPQRRNNYKPTWRDQRAGWRHVDDDDGEFYRKVVVTGFPAYTKADELAKKLSIFGCAQIEHIKNRVAIVAFETEQEAFEALQANNTIAVYGTILTIMKYKTKKQVMDLIASNRKVVRNEHKGPPIAAPADIDLTGDFDQQMQKIEEAIRLTQEEVNNINLLFEDVEKYMRMIFPTCEAVPFGSITTGQGIKSSDADCFLSLSPGAEGRPGPGAAELCSQFVGRAARLLRLYPEVFARLVAIPRANTPIIKFLHVPTNVNCDLNSKTPLGVQNSRLLGHLLGCDPRFGSAALLLKYWARVQQLSGTGRLTNYALLLLLVFYLQQTHLPPVYNLQDAKSSFIVEHWQAGFSRDPLPLPRPPPTPRDLLGGFFTFYAGFDFDELVVCPLLGRPLRKAEFESNVLPPPFSLYQRNIRDGLALGIRTSCTLCVQDPFELSHNVTSAVSQRLAQDIRAHIKLASAAFAQKESHPGDFLRTILFTRPATPEGSGDARLATRLSLPARTLQEMDDNWRPILRETIINAYKDLLFIELTRAESVSKEPLVEQEVYIGSVSRPIWRRGNNLNGRCSAADMLAWHRTSLHAIIHNKALPDLHLPFEVEFQFREKPRGLTIMTWPRDGADMEAFHAFRKFKHTFLHRWHRELLKPYLMVDPPRETTNSEKISPRKPEPRKKPAPIETVAFVNSNHKDLSESVAAISLTDDSPRDSDA